MILALLFIFSILCISMKALQGYKSYLEYKEIHNDIDNEGF